MRTSERFEETAESVPVILRIRSHRAAGPASVANRESTSASRRFKFSLRGEQIILLAATPLVALVITVGWKLSGHEEPVALKDTDATPAIVRIETVPGSVEMPILPSVEVDPTVIVTPDPIVPAEEKTVTDGVPNRTSSEFTSPGENMIRRTSVEQSMPAESMEQQDWARNRQPHTPGLRTSPPSPAYSDEGPIRIRSVRSDEAEPWNRRSTQR